MRYISLLLAAALSLAPAAVAATRPHYGGTLRLEMRGKLNSFEIGDEPNTDRAALRDVILNSVCGRLTTLDARGEPQPSLSTSWRSERDGRSWLFALRSGVLLHNGKTLSPQVVITALTAANPKWRVRAEGPQVLIQSDTPLLDLLSQLAEPRNSICLAGDKGQWIGSGPFQVGEVQLAERLELRAFDDAWQGRSFLDRIRIEMGRSITDQLIDLQAGKTDVIESVPGQRPGDAGILASQPIELFALVFATRGPTSSNPKLREAVAQALDRNSIFSVLLRRQGESSAGLLPEWISGYAHLFESSQDLTAARRLATGTTPSAPLSLMYDTNDPLAKLIAERVAVNAREAAIMLQPTPGDVANSSSNDIRLLRLLIQSPDAAAALAGFGLTLNLPALEKAHAAGSAENLYAIESEALKDYSIVPIAHTPVAFNSSSVVHDLALTPWGGLNLADVWVEATK